MNDDTLAQIREIREAAQKAMPGPWEWHGDVLTSGGGREGKAVLVVEPDFWLTTADEDDDATYIAAASPDKVDSLLALLERLIAERGDE